MPPPRSFVFDANVLIDYSISNRVLLQRIAVQIAPIYICSIVLEEVDQLSRRRCQALKLNVVDPTAEQMDTAAVRRGGLSVEDWLCFMLAQEQGAVCVTNDRRLRAECQAENVTAMRGLEPLVLLVQAKHVHPRVAVAPCGPCTNIMPTTLRPRLWRISSRELRADVDGSFDLDGWHPIPYSRRYLSFNVWYRRTCVGYPFHPRAFWTGQGLRGQAVVVECNMANLPL